MSMPLFHMIDGAPDPVAPFSHAVEADGWVFITGQMPFEGGRQRRMGGRVERQARRQFFAAQRSAKNPVIRGVFGRRRQGFHVLTLRECPKTNAE